MATGKTGKVWGTTTIVVASPMFELHHLDILPNMCCSWHSHAKKWNAFTCIEGVLFIEIKKSYGLTDVTVLRPGETTTVPPGAVHRFRTDGQYDYCIAVEMYYPDTLSEDIQRKDVGGSTLRRKR